MNEHIEKITREFTKQAEFFNEYQKFFTKDEFTSFAVENMQLSGDDNVLEIAAGTCGFGRSVAPFVRYITEFDVTKAMLEVGKKEAESQNLYNLSFVTGIAENLPFLDNSFDVVMSRLAFHHFKEPKVVFEQMTRVVKSDGKIVVLDMEAREENLRKTADYYETLRDTSHTRCLSKEEFADLGNDFCFLLHFCKTIEAPVKLRAWLDLTKTPEPVQTDIINAMHTEINGGEKTGFEPYIKDEEIYFNHKWMLCIFKKGE